MSHHIRIQSAYLFSSNRAFICWFVFDIIFCLGQLLPQKLPISMSVLLFEAISIDLTHNDVICS